MDSLLIDFYNEEHECRRLASKINSIENINRFKNLYNHNYFIRILSYLDEEFLKTEAKSYLTRGILNCKLEQTDLENKFLFLNGNQKKHCLDFFESFDFNDPKFEFEDEENDLFFFNKQFINPTKKEINLDNFKKIFNKETNNLLKGLDWSGIVVAGGLISSILFNKDPNSADIDIFIIDQIDVSKKIKHIYEIINKNSESDVLTIKTKNTITFCSDYPNRQVQIVLRECCCTFELLTFFDLDVCAVAYNGDKVLCIPRFLRCYRTDTNFIDFKKLDNKIFRQRIEKYYQKGFNTALIFYGKYSSNSRKEYIKNYFYTNKPNNNCSMYCQTGIPYGKDISTIKVKEYVDASDSPEFLIVDFDKLTIDSLIEKNWRQNLLFIKDLVKKCYTCGEFYVKTDNLNRLCELCESFNESKKKEVYSLDFSKNFVVITGGRENIGYELALFFLRKNCNVLITTRFPKNAFEKYIKEHDSHNWINNLEIYGLDFLNQQKLNEFIEFLNKGRSIDILINNAAQTFRRGVDYYKKELEYEFNKAIEFKQGGEIIKNYTENTSICIPQKTEDSWNNKIGDVTDQEFLEVNIINVMSPFKIIKGIRDNMTKDKTNRKYIINVSSPEGQFNCYKNSNHPHTNMAKASLNMMTRTVGQDFEKSDIIMFCSDTGWVSKMGKNNQDAPLKPLEAVHRVLYPIVLNQLFNINVSSKFFREFRNSEW